MSKCVLHSTTFEIHSGSLVFFCRPENLQWAEGPDNMEECTTPAHGLDGGDTLDLSFQEFLLVLLEVYDYSEPQLQKIWYVSKFGMRLRFQAHSAVEHTCKRMSLFPFDTLFPINY